MTKRIHFNRRDLPGLIKKCQAGVEEKYGEEIREKFGVSQSDQEKVTAAFLAEYEAWAHSPGNEIATGCSAKQAEKHARRGKEFAAQRVTESPPAGIDPMTISAILSICYYIFKFVQWLYDDE